jgi:hypothetical protein
MAELDKDKIEDIDITEETADAVEGGKKSIPGI